MRNQATELRHDDRQQREIRTTSNVCAPRDEDVSVLDFFGFFQIQGDTDCCSNGSLEDWRSRQLDSITVNRTPLAPTI
jgi:hypothetical protein